MVTQMGKCPIEEKYKYNKPVKSGPKETLL
jgi:hypothetical protein